MASVSSLISDWLGLNADSLSISQMCLRAVVVYCVALLMVRVVGARRFAGKYAAIDIILSITLGATLSRGINGSAAFFPTLLAGITLVALHWLLAASTFWLPTLEPLVKGRSRQLIQNGQINAQALQKSYLTHQDLKMALRSSGSTDEIETVEQANLEASGNISVMQRSQPQTVQVSVESGVQTVRIVFE